MKWIELSVQTHPEAVDAVANVFHEHGTGGVAIEQSYESGELQDGHFSGMPTVKAYLPQGKDLARRQERIERALWHLQAFNLSAIAPMKCREVDEEDWAWGWKEHFHPLKIGRIVIKPSWKDWRQSGDELVIELDPGMAFGTGDHPTTRLVLAALQKRVLPGTHVLDVGTGSGILAMAAAKLGAEVTALDIDEVAVRVAKQNVQANGLSERISVKRGSMELVHENRFDVIFANIIASVLIGMSFELAEVLRPGAEVLASGVLVDNAATVREAFQAAGIDIVGEDYEGEWVLLVGQRRL